MKDEEELIRIQKYLSECGILSRRAAEKAITEGKVTVNGVPAALGQKLNPSKDELLLDGVPVEKREGACSHTYIMLYKPAGYVATLVDEKGRPCVADLVRDVGKRIYPVGRLDLQSEGLLLLTDDGELTLRLTHPRHTIPKYYEVTVSAPVTGEQLRILRSPLVIDNYRIRPVECRVVERKPHYVRLGMTLYEGRNRQIRRMCEQAGVNIKHLKRLAVGKLDLGDLPKGQWRPLTEAEVAYLKGERI